MGKECMPWLSRRLWGGTSLKTAAKEASIIVALLPCIIALGQGALAWPTLTLVETVCICIMTMKTW